MKPSSTLWVSGLTRRSTAGEIFQIFSNFGKIIDIDGEDGEASRHVTFASVEEAQTALFSIRSQCLTGHFRKVVVDVAVNCCNMEQCDEVMQHSSTDRRDEPLEEGECTPEPEPALASAVPEDYTNKLVASTEVQLLGKGTTFFPFLFLLRVSCLRIDAVKVCDRFVSFQMVIAVVTMSRTRTILKMKSMFAISWNARVANATSKMPFSLYFFGREASACRKALT